MKRAVAGSCREGRMCMLTKQTEKSVALGGPTGPAATPVMEECRGRRVGTGDLVECKTRGRAGRCNFALSYGYSYFCRHPRRLEIAARAVAGQETE